MAWTEQECNRFYWSAAWKAKREEILRRDHYECQACRQRIKAAAKEGKTLRGYDARIHRAVCVHHIKELKDHPELALDDDNFVSLCHKDHDRIHGRDGENLSQYRYTKKFSDEKFSEKW